MFPLPISFYIKLGLVAVVLMTFSYIGYRVGHGELVSYKLEQAAQTAKLEHQYQEQADKIRKEKNDQIANINRSLSDAISQLRSRPSRAQQAGNGQGGTGATLSAEDAEFLVREDARADQIRVGLESCYKQYDSLK